MTTIAATMDAIAGDRMVTDDTTGTWYPAIKVRRIKGAVVGASGDSGDCIRFLDWAEAGFPEKKKPKFAIDSASESAARLLLVNAQGIHMMDSDDPYPELVAKDFYAIGSGSKGAMGALYAGKSLLDAMDIAFACDPYTRPPFDVLPLKEDK